MEFDIFNSLVPALLVIVVVLVFEDWAYFKARTKMQRAIITAVGVFGLVFIFNLFPLAVH